MLPSMLHQSSMPGMKRFEIIGSSCARRDVGNCGSLKSSDSQVVVDAKLA